MRATRALSYVCGFAAARAALFFAPILLANLIPIEAYGVLEFAQATAALAALVIGTGLPATVPLILLRPQITARWDTLLWLLTRLAALCLLAALIALAVTGAGFGAAVLIPLTTGVLLLQGLWAVYLKSKGQGTAAVFLEAGFWAAAVLGAAFVWLGLPAVSTTLALYGGGLLAVTFARQRAAHAPFTLRDLKDNVALGLPLVVTTFLTVLINSAGRVILGGLEDAETAGLYAVLYRATALPLVGHQLLTIAFFRRLFVWDAATLQRRVPVIVVGVSACVLVFWILAPHLAWMLGTRFETVFGQYPLEGHVILILTILWSAIALNDLLISRLQIAARVARVTGAYTAVGLLALAWATAASTDPMRTFVLLHAGLMSGHYLVQCAAIRACGHTFPMLWGSALAATGLGLAILLLLQIAK